MSKDFSDIDANVTDPLATPAEVRAEPAKPAAPRPIVPAGDYLRGMIDRWKKGPAPAYSTGLSQLDRLLGGGLRARSFLAMTGAAKSGKTSLFDQVVFDAVELAEGHAFGLVLSTEMSTEETIARWLALALFRARLRERSPDPKAFAGYSYIQTGEAWAHENTRAALSLAAERAPLGRLTAERLEPLSHVGHLHERILRARERWPDALPIVFLDPLQRLLAAPASGLNVDRINTDETARVSLVATQIYDLADREGLVVLAACDTTKAGASGASSTTGARGSYVLNHAATVVLGFHRMREETEAAHWPDRIVTLAARLAREDGAAEGEDAGELATWIAERVPARLWDHPDTERLGRRAVYLECSGNRVGPAMPSAFGAMPGAACFAEAATSADSIVGDFRPSKGEPTESRRKGR